MTLDSLHSKLQSEGILTLKLKVVPKSSRNEIVGVFEDGTLKLKIAAVPEKGKANEAICDYLAAFFGVPKRNVQIVRGSTSPTKYVTVKHD